MDEPVTSEMKDFVISNIYNITGEHEQMITGWRSVDLSEENIRHLHSLFTKCSKQEIRTFERANFLGDDAKEISRLMTTRLTRSDMTQHEEVEALENPVVPEVPEVSELAQEEPDEKDQAHVLEVPEASEAPEGPANITETIQEEANEKAQQLVPEVPEAPTAATDPIQEEVKEKAQQLVPEVPKAQEAPEAPAEVTDPIQEEIKENVHECVPEAPETPEAPEAPAEALAEASESDKPHVQEEITQYEIREKVEDVVVGSGNESKVEETHLPSDSVSEVSEIPEPEKPEQPEHQDVKTEASGVSLNENMTVSQKSKKKKKKKEKKDGKKEAEIEDNKEKEEIEEEEEKAGSEQAKEETPGESEETSEEQVLEKKDKRVNPFDNDNCIVEPLLTNRPLMKAIDEFDESFTALDNVTGNYMNPLSTALKSNLQRLATDISAEERNVRAKIESGEPVSIDNGVLADFIARANNVLKETEAVTVRKIAEAETRKFLSSVNITSEPYFDAISNELMQDIWPKTNKWRDVARIRFGAQEPEETLPQAAKKKLEDQLDRTVRAAIKSAGEPLDKRQIGRIRKAAIVYRDFDAKETRELQFRSDHTVKLVEYVSAYEATNQMDELMRLRLAIAFCTKRRDYFLKARPKNFMQFSYMYIFLLEKINTKTAGICACLNYHKTLKNNFDELEELMLNLFHEDYFLNETAT